MLNKKAIHLIVKLCNGQMLIRELDQALIPFMSTYIKRILCLEITSIGICLKRY